MIEEMEPSPAESPRVLTRRLRPQAPRIEPRDFRLPARPYRRIVRELETISGSLSLRLSAAFSDSLQRKMVVQQLPVRFPAFGVMRRELDERTWAQPISSRSGERGLLLFDAALQESLLALLLGTGLPRSEDEVEDGDDGASPAPRAYRFGFLSRSVMRSSMAVALRELNRQLGVERDRVYGLDEEPGRLGLGGYLADGEACVLLDFAVRGEEFEGVLSAFLPLRPLQSLLKKDRGPVTRPPDPRARVALESLVKGLDMPVSVRVGRADIEVEEYLRLAVGDVLVLDQELAEPLAVVVDDKALFLGRPGRSGGRLAVRVTGPAE